MVGHCLNCERQIKEPKERQKFCSARCRYRFHNRLRDRRGFVRELLFLCRRYKVFDLELFDEATKRYKTTREE